MSERFFIPLGNCDFEAHRLSKGYYVDKTNFIDEFFENSIAPTVTLITRPRRFGKSLLFSMLEYFFDRKHAGKDSLFEGLAVTRSKHWDKRHQYPVISFCLSDIVLPYYSPEEVEKALINFLRHNLLPRYLNYNLTVHSNTPISKKNEITDEPNKISFPNAFQEYDYENLDALFSSGISLKDALHLLTARLSQAYGSKVILLIDEYDAMVNDLPLGSKSQETAIGLLRALLGKSLKGNAYLEFAIITGVQRVAKESIFSGLNNLSVQTVLDDKFATSFGFTQEEMQELAAAFNNQTLSLDSIKQWYNGYWIGGKTIYNPWSIILALGEKKIAPYWLNTSSNTLVIESLKSGGIDVLESLYKLSRSETLTLNLFKGVTLGQITSHPNALWTLLIHAGYLTLDPEGINDSEFEEYSVRIPNLEISRIFTTSLIEMFDLKLKLNSFYVMGKLFLEPDLNKMQSQLSKELRESLLALASFFDTAQGESYYHGLITGILLSLRTYYQILSNRESGNGRSDLLLTPLPTSPSRGYVLEFKIAPSLEALEETAKNAMDQILSRSYASAFPSSVSEKIALGIAFYKKNLVILMQPLL